ncbi:MAG: amino acid adenylation domain-containing protein [Gemmatimonadota bacterium]
MTLLLQDLLARSAEKWPAKEVARLSDETLSYGRLDTLSTLLAGSLRDAGLRRGDRVGVCLGKSLGSLVSVFAVLRAGGVCVPFDPNAPVGRHAHIVRDCGIRILITEASQLRHLLIPAVNALPVECVLLTDELDLDPNLPAWDVQVIPWSEILRSNSGKSRAARPLPSDPAYILYTSGSTGMPKGVTLSHLAIFSFVEWAVSTFRLGSEDRVTNHAPLHFDLSTFDLFATVMAGGTVLPIPASFSNYPVRFAELLEAERITATYLVPSMLRLLVNYGDLESYDLSSLRLVLFAGEVLPIKYLRALIDRLPNAEFFNLYGPTETNVCTYHRVTPADVAPEVTKPVPIGRACESVEVFAVGEDHRIVTAPGQEGELWVRGANLASGYWGDRERTSSRFIQNPFQPTFLDTVYRTGDVVALASDGVSWEFVGRKDQMVKSRGYRIELGEVESVLLQHELVVEAAVVAVPDELLGNRLAAFVVGRFESADPTGDLMAHCGRFLPPYMLPETLRLLDGLPKTSTGKLDRVALSEGAALGIVPPWNRTGRS